MGFSLKRLLWICLLALSFSGEVRAAEPYDYAPWDAFLKKNVNEKGEVAYRAIVKDPQELDACFARLTAVSLSELASLPREEALAFWLNAYHLVLIKQVVENYPVTSVQKIPSFWDIAMFHFGAAVKGQKQYSLNNIRVNELMGVFHDEKIHLALSLAARGGPKMMREAFTGPRVEGQLFLLTRQFVNNPVLVDIKPGRKKIRLSKIFKWYAKDFNLDFGTPEPFGKFSATDTAVLSFLAYYLEDESKGEFLQEANYKIQYPAFDWSLNDQPEQNSASSR